MYPFRIDYFSDGLKTILTWLSPLKVFPLTLSSLGKHFSRRHFETFFIFFPRKQVLTFHANKETICMKSQSLFSRKSKKKLINLSSAEYVQRAVKDPSRKHAYIMLTPLHPTII